MNARSDPFPSTEVYQRVGGHVYTSYAQGQTNIADLVTWWDYWHFRNLIGSYI